MVISLVVLLIFSLTGLWLIFRYPYGFLVVICFIFGAGIFHWIMIVLCQFFCYGYWLIDIFVGMVLLDSVPNFFMPLGIGFQIPSFFHFCDYIEFQLVFFVCLADTERLQEYFCRHLFK